MKYTVITLLVGIALLMLAACGGGAAGSDPLAGTSWTLVSLDGRNLVPNTTVTAQFDEDQITGIACNNYFGEYTVSGDAIAINGVGSTEMFCADPAGVMDQETAYFNLLRNVETFSIQGDRLTLTTTAGETLVFASSG